GVQGAAVVTPLTATQDGDVLVGTVYSSTSPQSAATTDLTNRLVDDTLPQAVRGTDARTYVTGTTAAQFDFRDIVADRLPLGVSVVVARAVVVGLEVGPGVVAAVQAAGLDVRSPPASRGGVVAGFPGGRGGPALGVVGTAPAESYVAVRPGKMGVG